MVVLLKATEATPFCVQRKKGLVDLVSSRRYETSIALISFERRKPGQEGQHPLFPFSFLHFLTLSASEMSCDKGVVLVPVVPPSLEAKLKHPA